MKRFHNTRLLRKADPRFPFAALVLREARPPNNRGWAQGTHPLADFETIEITNANAEQLTCRALFPRSYLRVLHSESCEYEYVHRSI
jgi:hypothetical protein